ncbi:MAG: hypothetical protein HQ510_08235 [Candidatus Marinimicrobia bacterium]|nr:hypothetical protein [Candidatus Neomarinimicrobiota bacterium]
MKINSKWYLVIFTITALFSSDQRINALGGNPAFWPDDDTNIRLFPNRINDWNFVQLSGVGQTYILNSRVGDFPIEEYNVDFNNQGTEGSIVFGDEKKYGFWLSNEAFDAISAGYGSGNIGWLVSLKSLKISADFGFEDRSETDYFGIDIGYGIETATGEVSVFTKADIYTASGSLYAPGIHGNSSLYNISYNIKRSINIKYLSNIYCHLGYSWSSGNGSLVYDDSYNFGISTFGHFYQIKNTDAMFSIGLEYNNQKYQGDTWQTILFPSITLAVENKITDWATIRSGINKYYKLYTGTKDLSSRYSLPAIASFGLGFNYGGLILDIDVTSQFFSSPFEYILGNEGPLATSATLSYVW